MAALRHLGHRPAVLRVGEAPGEAAALKGALEGIRGLPALAGPLGSVARAALGREGRLVGLSWGYDLHDLEQAGDLGWLPALNGLVVDSRATWAIAETAGVPSDRMTLLPWGVDLDVFRPDGAAADLAALDLPPHARIVLSLRAHEPKYRVADIVSAFSQVARAVPEAVLVIGHVGSLTDELRRQVDECGLADRTRFAGTLAESALPAILRRTACYVTAAEVDGTSISLLQAMACRTPVAASATPGNLGWVRDGSTGLTFPVGDVAALAEAVISTLEGDPAELTARAHAEVCREADWWRNIARLDDALFPRT